MLKRNSYLVDKTFSSFLLSTILSSVSVSLSVTVDSVIVGNLLGAQALAAVSLISPVAQIFNAFTALINVGGAALVSVLIGRQDTKQAGRICATSVFISAALGVLWMLAGLFGLHEISGLLTRDEVLLPLVEQYLRIMLLSAPVYLLLPGICTFIRTDNAAKRASLALIVGNVCNLVFDVVFIRCFNMGVAGSSLATTCGYLIGLCVALLHFNGKNNNFSIRRPDLAQTRNIIVSGAPIALASVLMCVRIYFTNTIIQQYLGSAAMPVMATCFNLLMLASMFIGGVSQAFLPMGGILRGQDDFRGLHMVARRAWRTLLICLGLLFLLILLLPGVCLRVFGLTPSGEALRALRLFAFCIPFFGANYLIMVIHQTLGHNKLAIANAAMDSLVVILVLFFVASIVPSMIWIGFAIGEACVLLLVVLLSELDRKKDKALSPLMLLPPADDSACDFSVHSDMSDLESAMDDISAYLRSQGLDKWLNSVQLCCEEILAVYKEPAAKSARPAYADVRLRGDGERLSLCVTNAGLRFDPIANNKDDLSLILCNAMCSQMRYSYIAGENVVTFVFSADKQIKA